MKKIISAFIAPGGKYGQMLWTIRKGKPVTLCMKHNIYLCDQCLAAVDPDVCCKFPAVLPPYHFVSKKGFDDSDTRQAFLKAKPIMIKALTYIQEKSGMDHTCCHGFWITFSDTCLIPASETTDNPGHLYSGTIPMMVTLHVRSAFKGGRCSNAKVRNARVIGELCICPAACVFYRETDACLRPGIPNMASGQWDFF
ncbi:MAG: hypothetical protein U5K27_02880 [Desulfotignum sp.]|nr:hypothetical protein [Desulfotignum sp.]